VPPSLDKASLRALIWDRLVDAGVVLPPGAHGRIPNHVDADAAAARLATDPWFRAAHSLKCNPDTPHRPVRAAALCAGKVVFMAVPKLATAAPFLRLDGARLTPAQAEHAATKAGAAALGTPVPVHAVPPIDLVVAGCVAVTPTGDRLGKGGGYADIEWGLLTETGAIGPHTRVATTVHALQLVAALPMEPHDVGFDLVATADRLLRTGRTGPRPHGIRADLDPRKRAAIPALQRRIPGSRGPRDEDRRGP
jgi:5-formyltetrahydrofolate cyclo-ligase